MPATLTIVIATYNERNSLPELVQGIHDQIPTARLLIVDDNSPDGTGNWVQEKAETDPRINLLHRDSKEGLGAATLAGLRQASQLPCDWIGTMDADLSHRPEDLAELWRAASEEPQAGVIIGSRYVSGGRIENWSLRRRAASRCVNGFARWMLWLTSHDNSSAFRLYRTTALQEIDLKQVNCRGFAYLEQILMHLQRAGIRFHEVPIVFSERQLGESKVTTGEVFRNLCDIFRLAIRRH